MFNFLPFPLIFVLFTLTIFFNCLFIFILIIPFAIIKIIFPFKAINCFVRPALDFLGTLWLQINNLIISLLCKINLKIDCSKYLIQSEIQNQKLNQFKNKNSNHDQIKNMFSKKKNYLLICNHQSWVDMFILGKVFANKIPPLKFFIKKNLLWLPFVGLACWAFDFPFMQRYSKEYLKKHSEKKGKDLETTKHFCKKIADHPFTICNFLEGTRFTKQKQQKQKSPYKHLLKPKAGGIAFVLNEMQGKINSIINVTINYPLGIPSTIDLFCGKIKKINLTIKEEKIPQELACNFFNNIEAQQKFYAWLNRLWQKKDLELKYTNHNH